MPAERILIVDDEEGMRRLLGRVLSREGYETVAVGSGAEAMRQVRTETFDLVITDIKMPEMDGLRTAARIKAFDPSLPIIVITAYGTVENAVQALRAGAYDYLTKPFETDEIKLTVAKALERQRLLAENRYLHEELEERYRFSGIVGTSPGMRRIFEMASSVAASNASVLITGESRDRQGADRPLHPFQFGAQGEAVHRPQLRGALAKGCWRANFSAMNGALSPARWRPRRGASNWRTRGRCSSTRSAR